MVPGDLHLTEPGLDNVRVARWVIDEANQRIKTDFVQFIDDNVQTATQSQFRLFNELRGHLEMPHHVLVGDHDVKNDPARSKASVPWKRWPPPTMALRAVTRSVSCTTRLAVTTLSPKADRSSHPLRFAELFPGRVHESGL